MTDTTRPLTGYVAHIDVSPDDDQAPTLTVCLDHPCTVVPVGTVTITPDHPAPAEVVNRHPRHELGMTCPSSSPSSRPGSCPAAGTPPSSSRGSAASGA